MKRFLGLVAALTLISSAVPATALTINQAYDELAGGHCAGNTCTFAPIQSGSVSYRDNTTSTGPSPSFCNGHIGYWSSPAPGICNIDISDDMNHSSGGGMTLIDGRTCSTTSKTVSHDPASPFTSGWSVTASVSSRTGAC